MKQSGLKSKIFWTIAGGGLLSTVIAIGTSFYFNEKEFHNGLVDKSRMLHSRMDVTTKYVAKQGGLKLAISQFKAKYSSSDQLTDEDKKVILQQVPIYAAMKIGSEDAEKEHYQFRVFSNEPRRKENQASLEELEIFSQFENNPELKEIVKDHVKTVTVYRPVYLKESQGCLSCHGDPATSPWGNGKDILGFKMENWKDGKLHGVFAISNNVAEVHKAQAEINGTSSTVWMGLFITFGCIFVLLLTVFLLRAPFNELTNISDKLTNDASEVGSAVSQIFSVSQELSTASSQQSAAVQETAASIEEISAMVRKSSDNAVESDSASVQSKNTAEKGKQAVEQMVVSMQAINKSNDQIVEAVHTSNQNVSEIVQVIQEIELKTKIINDIVFQTKLLSFNASVEAARAGEQGKGFAVVAEEVGNLAQMSGNAAKEISGLLNKSIKKVESIVQVTKTTVDSLMSASKITVSQGTQVAQECEGILSQIVTSSGEVSSLISQIAIASREQSNGVAEISTAMQQIDQSTNVGARSATACAAAAEQLATKVKELRETSAILRKTLTGKVTVSKFRWSKEYLLEVPEMDEQHQILIQKMNHLSDVMMLSNSNERKVSMKTAFTDLVDYTVLHFAEEEKFLKSIEYPEFTKHKAIHEVLLGKVSKFKTQVENDTLEGNELMDFVSDWLMRHILGNDKQYAHYFRKSGKSSSQGSHRFEDAA